MGAIGDRLRVVTRAYVDRFRHGLPAEQGPLHRDVIFILDGVGGFQFAPVMIRRAIRSSGAPVGTVVIKWQFGLAGEIWSDLVWLRRNRVVAARVARRLLAFRRAHPETRIHLFGYSGGGGVSVLACEALHGRGILDSLILVAPALSPEYNLAPALKAVQRCTAFVSEKDRFLLGWGTRLFGTIDRRRTESAGKVGFRMPVDGSCIDRSAYGRFSQVRWSPAFTRWGVSGGHIGWLSERFLSSIVLPLVSEGRIPAEHAPAVEKLS